jgi:hypothetical protein
MELVIRAITQFVSTAPNALIWLHSILIRIRKRKWVKPSL